MGKKDSLLERLAGNMAESLGRSQGGEGEGRPAQPPDLVPLASTSTKYEGRSRDRSSGVMEIDRIVPDPHQPRQHFDQEALEGLAASIKARGLLTPIRIRWDEAIDKWVILCGDRR